MFIDRAKIQVIAGDGGNGCLAFRREKFVPKGGPSGGDGGKGGDVYIECTDRVNTLLHFQYRRIFKGQRGRHGEGDNRHGKDGEDVIIPVPPGTQVYREQPCLELLHDFARSGEQILVAKGGGEDGETPGLPLRQIRRPGVPIRVKRVKSSSFR